MTEKIYESNVNISRQRCYPARDMRTDRMQASELPRAPPDVREKNTDPTQMWGRSHPCHERPPKLLINPFSSDSCSICCLFVAGGRLSFWGSAADRCWRCSGGHADKYCSEKMRRLSGTNECFWLMEKRRRLPQSNELMGNTENTADFKREGQLVKET